MREGRSLFEGFAQEHDTYCFQQQAEQKDRKDFDHGFHRSAYRISLIPAAWI